MNKQNFSYVSNGDSVAAISVDTSQIYGSGTAASPHLTIPGRIHFFQIQPKSIDYVFTEITARLIDQKLGAISEARALLNRVQRPHHCYTADDHLYFEFRVDSHQIAELEKARAGKDVILRLRCNLQVQEHGVISADEQTKRPALFGLRNISELHAEVEVTIQQKIWLERVLTGTGFGKVHIIELPAVPLESCAALKDSFEALRQARLLHNDGHYDVAVARCRTALDPFFVQVPVEPDNKNSKTMPELRKKWLKRLGESTYKWLNDALGSVKAAGNLTVHTSHRHFDQFESQMILAIATTLVAFAARAPESDKPE